ncbi:class I SAM-dependent methyltransferase [Winogradskyella sp. PG-2]|uniref:class I SAM-dependent methyltransferase n=1 Tax=Winogradskyella sp. PG-2 TaxID=754409 RepID=UPI000458733E|nr:class I SAM-dependent methyltransferase [Winogradskyella sp. PG-2]BAO75187.1 SAM-dependent methyltransferases [Winogradskyella sp. PG-2]
MPKDFDKASVNYDNTFTFSNIGKAQRKMVYRDLNPILKQDKKLSILELNCGTGEDAIHFAQLQHNVFATDISEGMISVAKNKLYPKNLKFSILDITTISETTFNEKFDFIFSNFGGLNCLSTTQLETFFKTSAQLLNPNGKMAIVIMPKKCLWERLYFSLKGDFKNAKRRQTNKSIIANVEGFTVKTWYYNPEEIKNLTNTFYNIKKIKPIGLTIPPSYLENSFLSKRPFLSVFKQIDALITGSFWAKYADHFLIELQKK